MAYDKTEWAKGQIGMDQPSEHVPVVVFFSENCLQAL